MQENENQQKKEKKLEWFNPSQLTSIILFHGVK